MTDDILRSLAAKAGIADHWTDQSGFDRQVSPETLRAILDALGLSTASDADLRNSLSMVEGGANLVAASHFTTARVGQSVTIPVIVPEGTTVEIETEGGGVRSIRAEAGFDGALTLPAFDQPGYHRVRLTDQEFMVATAPARCVTLRDLAGESSFGLAAQIYSLRTAGDGGIGHFGGVAALGRAAAGYGADALAISPVHALYGADAGHFSPYSPSTRLFLNPLHADPADALPADFIQAVVAAEGLGDEMARLSALPLVDWAAATPIRRRLLRALYLRLAHGEADVPGRFEFDRFRLQASPLLRAHATFEALHAHHLAESPGLWNWRDWPEPHRDPDGEAVSAFVAAHHGEVELEIFKQWLTARSYAEAQRACREGGMRIGLIADLAIGMDGAGSHAWSRQQDILKGLSIGAPPDYYSAEGQSWGLTTFSPRGLGATGFAPFIETLRAVLRHVGGVRIDHVMGMSRLWLVPQGAKATDGAYVAFPSESLFRLIALESWRHKAAIIGEDLGTLPDGFRDYLREQGVAGLRVLRFERDRDGYFAPEYWDRDAAGLTTTHDLVPTAGWWAGSDLAAGSAGDREAEDVRAWDRGLLWSAFTRQDVADGERPAPEDTDPVVDAAVAYVARTPCALKLVSMEDILGLRDQPNVPGTTTEKPNWRNRLPGDAEHLLEDEKAQTRLAVLNAARPRPDEA